MRLKYLAVMAAILTVAASPAMALPVDDNSNPAGELDLYQIYNSLYGTTYSGTTVGANSLEDNGLRLALDEVFALIGDGNVSFVARYAGQDQRFGYYTDPFGMPTGDPSTTGVDGDFHWLFDVTGPANQIITGGATPHFGSIPSSDSPIGFYDNTPAGGSNTWFSQALLNSDGQDHMVAFWATINGQVSTDTFIIAFEDRLLDQYGTSDQDYNDLVVEVHAEGFRPFDPVPEPATVSLLLLGLTAAVVRRRFGA